MKPHEDAERLFPGCRWSVGRPVVGEGKKEKKFRKGNPYEAWLMHGDIGTKSWLSVSGDGPTPDDALWNCVVAGTKELDRRAEEKEKTR